MCFSGGLILCGVALGPKNEWKWYTEEFKRDTDPTVNNIQDFLQELEVKCLQHKKWEVNDFQSYRQLYEKYTAQRIKESY